MPKWSKKITIISLWLCFMVMLSGCKEQKIHVLIPTGSPQYAAAFMQNTGKYDFTVVAGADALTAGFNDIGYDIIFAPVNLGAKMYQAKPNYQLIGVVTWGNYYLISESPIDLTHVSQMDITAFGENQIPDFMIKFILEQKNIEGHFTYLDSVASITSAYVLDSSKVYLIAEPSLSILQTQKPLHYLNLQTIYQTITGETGFPQAGVFVKKGLAASAVNAFKSELIQSIFSLKQDENAHDVLTAVGITIPKAIYLNAVTRSHIDFLDSTNSKTALVTFFEQIYAFNPNFIGNIPDDTFYR